MPRQFYLSADDALFTPGTWKGGWDTTVNAASCLLDTTKTTADPTKFTIQAVSSEETSASPLYRAALGRFVSGPMLSQTISGTVQIVAGVLSSDALAEFYFSLHIWVTTGDSDTVRGTLLNQYAELASSNNPFPTTPKGRDLIVSAALNAVTLSDDDRVVVEVGYIARNSSTSAYTGTLYYGTDYYSSGSPDMSRDN